MLQLLCNLVDFKIKLCITPKVAEPVEGFKDAKNVQNPIGITRHL